MNDFEGGLAITSEFCGPSSAFIDAIYGQRGVLFARPVKVAVSIKPEAHFPGAKRAFDLVVSLALLPILGLCAVGLAIVNRSSNAGPLIFHQKRMGKDCKPIRVIKFRSMTSTHRINRRAHDPLEINRITTVGRFIRRTRIDELPQIINVLRGEMSLIGPRPDYLPHALHYLRTIPGYHERHAVKPGITGLAQVDLGYAEGADAARAKVAADLTYVRRHGYVMDTRIALKTLRIVASGGGR